MSLPAGLVDDEFFLPRLQKLYTAVTEAVDEAAGPPLAARTLWTGTAIPPLGTMGGEECGVLWITPGQILPTVEFPLPTEGASTCSTLRMMSVTIGIARCMPRPQDMRDVMADSQDIFDSIRLQMSDMNAIRKGVTCGYANEDEDRPASLESWTPIEDLAGTIGGYWQVWIG